MATCVGARNGRVWLASAFCLVAALVWTRGTTKVKGVELEQRKLYRYLYGYETLSLFGLSPGGLIPSPAPSNEPTVSPSPTVRPTATPSRYPSSQPSSHPSTSFSPSRDPSVSPTGKPSSSPSSAPSSRPSVSPTMAPSPRPSVSPSRSPSVSPTAQPSSHPSVSPTMAPSPRPSVSPSRSPSVSPTAQPSSHPSVSPTDRPSTSPSSSPTGLPSYSPSSLPSQSPTDFFAETIFYAVADVPYNTRQKQKLPGQIASIANDAAFVIHLGDIKSSSAPCDNTTFSIAEGMLAASKVPAFIVPGDNEIGDCKNPDQAFLLWKSKFVRFDRRFWTHDLDVKTMPGRPESFTFINRGTLFIGLHLVGSPVIDRTEWNNRTRTQLDWTIELIEQHRNGPYGLGAIVVMAHANLDGKHRLFVDPLVNYIRDVLQNSIPIMFIGGDNHSWLYEPNYKSQSSFLRVRKTGGTSEPPLRIVVNPSASRFDNDYGVKASTATAFQLTRFPTTNVATFGSREETNNELYVEGGIASEDLDDDVFAGDS